MNSTGKENIKLSIVIAAWNGNKYLRQCLVSLEKQSDLTEIEIIVAANFQIDLSEDEFSFPVNFIKLPETANVPELRRDGIAAASGEILGVLEDHCLFDKRWVEAIKEAHKTTFAVVGGSVENASANRMLNWAVYFYDYGKYMMPNNAGAANALSGINVSYKRTALEKIQEKFRNGFYETFVNEELKKIGWQLYLEPSAIVYHNKDYVFGQTVYHCYHLARSFAAKRVSDSTILKRLFYTAITCVLPILLLVRIFTQTIKKGRNFNKLLISLPVLILLLVVWSYGEFCGYLLGAGKSAGKWR